MTSLSLQPTFPASRKPRTARDLHHLHRIRQISRLPLKATFVLGMTLQGYSKDEYALELERFSCLRARSLVERQLHSRDLA